MPTLLIEFVVCLLFVLLWRMSQIRDYYRDLEIGPEATHREIKKQYKKLG